MKTSLGQYIPGLQDLRQGVGEIERQVVNARIAASTAKTDALSEPSATLSIHVEVWSFVYEGASLTGE